MRQIHKALYLYPMRFLKLKLFLLTFIMASILFGQFKSAQLTIDDRMLRDSDRQILFSLKNDVHRFFSQTYWDEDYTDLDLTPQIQLIFESTTSKGAVTIYQCQTLFAVGADQKYFDKSVQFSFSEGTGLYYDPVLFDPLASFLSFYAFIMLAGEMDTYDPLGGTATYEKARAIALRGSNSDYSKGWNNRADLIDEISSNFGYRRAKFAFYYGRDLFIDGDMVAAIDQFDQFFKGLEEVFNHSPRDHYTLIFLKAYAPKLSQMFAILNRKEYLETLIDYDPDNEEIYIRGLDAISR